MKALTKKTTIILTIAILGVSYIFASAALINISTNPDVINIELNKPISDFEKALSVQYNFEEEEFINDIPFDTQEVKIKNEYQQAINVDFCFEDEATIIDFPYELYEAIL